MGPETSNINSAAYTELTKETALSKYLAMFLFTVLPFLGGWIGYSYAPTKTLEVERVTFTESKPTIVVNSTTSTEEVLTPYEKRMKRIGELESDPSLKISDVIEFQMVVPFEERADIYLSARNFVKNNSNPELEFGLIFNWKKGDWVNFTVIPENINTDNAQLFMYKENGQWVLKGFGTAFPDLYMKYPELFSE